MQCTPSRFRARTRVSECARVSATGVGSIPGVGAEVTGSPCLGSARSNDPHPVQCNGIATTTTAAAPPPQPRRRAKASQGPPTPRLSRSFSRSLAKGSRMGRGWGPSTEGLLRRIASVHLLREKFAAHSYTESCILR